MQTSAIGETVRVLRQKAGFSLDQLSRLAMISRSTLVKIESGSTPDPGFSVVARLLDACGAGETTICDLHSNVVELTRSRHVGVGYEGRTVEQLIDFLHSQKVRLVADVRLNPISRKPGLSKTRLSSTLASAGIGYRHFPQLGNPKANRAAYSDPDDQRPRNTYRARLAEAGPQDSLRELSTLGLTGKIGVLCFEAEQRACHRNEVIAALADLAELNRRSHRPLR
jgi:transcriptional regulator with XRE-family HTH domain